jgi:catechol 2,3-dioxygenase-like lactoylglutathione lyase family enzyme
MAQTIEQPRTDATETSPVRIRKLGHVVFRVRDVDRSIRFYTEILNFRLSDVNENGMVFLNTCGDHHTIAVAPASAGESAAQPGRDQLGLSHFAMEVGSIDELFEIRAFLHRKGIETREGRKGPGCNVEVSFDDPDGYHVELYTNMDQVGPDNRTRPAEQFSRTNSLEEARDNPVPTSW